MSAMTHLEYFKEYIMRKEKDPQGLEEKVEAGYACETKRTRIIFFDLETSSPCERSYPNANVDSIIEIGAVCNQSSFSKLCNPGHPIYTTAIHGITTEDVKNAPPTREVVKDFLAWAQPGDGYEISMLIAHNAAQFDLKVLRAHITKHFPDSEYDDIYIADTLHPLKQHSGASSGKLEDIYRHMFGQEYVERHRALEDAKDLQRMMNHICAKSEMPCTRMLSGYAYPLKPKSIKIQYFQVPFSEKESAKKLGAKWDPVKKLWYGQTIQIGEALAAKFPVLIT